MDWEPGRRLTAGQGRARIAHREPRTECEYDYGVISAGLGDWAWGEGRRRQTQGKDHEFNGLSIPTPLGEAELESCFLEGLENPPWTGLEPGRESNSIMYV